MRRRDFLLASAAPFLGACEMSNGRPVALPAGDLLGPDLALGHRLRRRDFPAPTQQRKVGIAIVGGGIAGLSAAWQLTKRGITDWQIFELDEAVGGNARSGSNAVSPFPWGAHYLPLPTVEATLLRELLKDLNILQGDPRAATPVYDDAALVHAPQERLLFNGLWQDSIWPRAGVDQRELDQYKRFEELAQQLRNSTGADGKRAFASPSQLASRDPKFTLLDQTSFTAWLKSLGFDSPHLHWVADYATRDDFGMRAANTSAWAGMHYFTCRDGRGLHADPHAVLTWPEGNGFLVKRLEEWLQQRVPQGIARRSPCIKILQHAAHCDLEVFDANSQHTMSVRADRVIWCAPAFVLARAWQNAPSNFAPQAGQIDIAPWLVANLTLSEPPYDLGPAELAWDNVLYDSPSMGYVVATHQQIKVRQYGPTVLTYYLPLADLNYAAARKALLETSQTVWAERILRDLERAHPAIRQITQRIDLWRWAHAMPKPVPGFLSLPIRKTLEDLSGALLFGHSDLSGLSLFEEANHAGATAATRALR